MIPQDSGPERDVKHKSVLLKTNDYGGVRSTLETTRERVWVDTILDVMYRTSASSPQMSQRFTVHT